MADELAVFQRQWLLIKIGRAFAQMDEAAARGDFETAHRLCEVAGELLHQAAVLSAQGTADEQPQSA